VTIQTSAARAAVLSDAGSNCSLTVTSAGVTVDATSVPITVSGSNCVVQFKTAGTYTVTIPSDVSTVNYLVVGGGGGGASGGGGGGGVLQGTNFVVTPSSNYTVTVGDGGISGSGGSNLQAGDPKSTNGDSSIFATITALGGGSGGQGNVGYEARSGGSGGGSRYDCTNATPGACAGIGTPSQGNNGAASTYPSYGGGAGGGGAGSAGQNTILSNIGGKGGNGVIGTITGLTYGGGGGGGINANSNQFGYVDGSGASASQVGVATTGGGQGGSGGGGRGSSYGYSSGTRGQYANATAGTPNTGGGGGGTDPEDLGAGKGGSGIVVLSYVATANLRSITFNSNINTSTTSTQSVTSGVSTPLTGNSFSANGYVFRSWNTAADGSGTSFADRSNITFTTNTILYAQWVAGVNHTITFAVNNGSGSMATQTAGIPTNLNANTLTRSNYSFAGWNTVANGTGYSYSDQGLFPFSTDTTLYAQWTAIVTNYTVTFFGNGADAGATPSQTAGSSQALTLNGFTRTGYSFLGWDTNYASGSASYLDGQAYAFTGDLSLYAIWVTQASRTITFDPNLGSGTMASQAATSNTVLNANTFTRSGYTFRNWNTQADGLGASYLNNYTYSFAASKTLYAIWSQNYTISYDSNTANAGSVPISQGYYASGPTVTIQSNSGSLSKVGNILTGWNSVANGTGTSYALGQVNSTFSTNTTLFAQWSAATYTILYSGNTNTSGSVPSSQSYIYGGSALTLSNNPSPLAKTNYLFSGWNTAPDGSGTTYASGATNTTFTQDTVLFARWLINATLSIPQSSGATYRTTNTLTLTIGAPGKYTFYASGKRIPGCINMTGNPPTLNCYWKPSMHGQINISVIGKVGGSSYSSNMGTYNIGWRAGSR
jgi:hypothetical protein